jgi:hypothetical protein
LDLKSYYRGHRYAIETTQMLLQKPAAIFLALIVEHITHFRAIHPHVRPTRRGPDHRRVNLEMFSPILTRYRPLLYHPKIIQFQVWEQVFFLLFKIRAER